MSLIPFSILFLVGVFIGFYAKKLLHKLTVLLRNKTEEELSKKDDDAKPKDNNIEEDEEEIDFEEEDLKMVFLVREDLKMGAGKIAAQVAHAAVGLFSKITRKGSKYYKDALKAWDEFGSKKIVLKAKSLEELEKIHHECRKFKIPSMLISDAGHTQVDPGTVTVLGIGPEISDKLNKITGKFRLMN